MRRVSSGILIVGMVAACGPPAVDVDAEGAALMQISRDWSDLVPTGDLDAIMAGWAEDAVMLAPGMPPIEGKAAIRAYVEAGQQMPGFTIRWEPLTVHVSRSGDMAYMLERNVMTVDDSLGNSVTTYGKVVTVWRKDADGMWRNVVDTWNEAPPPNQ